MSGACTETIVGGSGRAGSRSSSCTPSSLACPKIASTAPVGIAPFAALTVLSRVSGLANPPTCAAGKATGRPVVISRKLPASSTWCISLQVAFSACEVSRPTASRATSTVLGTRARAAPKGLGTSSITTVCTGRVTCSTVTSSRLPGSARVTGAPPSSMVRWSAGALSNLCCNWSNGRFGLAPRMNISGRLNAISRPDQSVATRSKRTLPPSRSTQKNGAASVRSKST